MSPHSTRTGMREQLLAQLADLIAETDKLSDFERGELRGKIADKPGLNRCLRTTPAGKLRITPPLAISSSWKSSAAGAT